MKYPNAFAGIKKILTSQIVQLIGAFCLVFGAVIAYAGATSENVALVIVGGAVALVASVVEIVALILNLLGLNQARKDETNFHNAFIFAIVGVILSVLGAVLATPYPDVADWLSFVTRIFEITVIELTVLGIIALADRLGRDDVSKLGHVLQILISILWAIVLVVRFVGNRVDRISNVMDLISSVLELVVTILFIVLLSKAKKMLEQN
ncbi:MAG: hypothetical protein IKN57_04055 [Parasporobacterium sp.]|nr:hypothetical protein [Parasporobacterium sp.]